MATSRKTGLQNNTNNNNFKEADAFLKLRLVVKDEEGNIISTEAYICKDVPLHINTSNFSRGMVKHSKDNPDYVYELQGVVHVAQPKDTSEVTFF